MRFELHDFIEAQVGAMNELGILHFIVLAEEDHMHRLLLFKIYFFYLGCYFKTTLAGHHGHPLIFAHTTVPTGMDLSSLVPLIMRFILNY